MKSVFKSIGLILLIFVFIGVCFCVYVFQAPPVPDTDPPKLQVHSRTSVRGRPTVNSKPKFYTKDVYLFSIDQKYISNLNYGSLSDELLFSVVLGMRSRYGDELLDKELKTKYNWQKMFADAEVDVSFSSGTHRVDVVISGQDWVLSDRTGAAYRVEKTGDSLDIYLPDLLEAFNNKRINLSTDLKSTIEKVGKSWLIIDKKAQQTYEIRKGPKNLDVFQQSKYPLVTSLFSVNLVALDALNEGSFSEEIKQGFETQEIPLSQHAKLRTIEVDNSWEVVDGSQKYIIRNENGWLKVFIDLESKWLLIRGKGSMKGWVQRERGIIFMPPQHSLSSRQQLKEKLIVFFDGLTGD